MREVACEPSATPPPRPGPSVPPVLPVMGVPNSPGYVNDAGRLCRWPGSRRSLAARRKSGPRAGRGRGQGRRFTGVHGPQCKLGDPSRSAQGRRDARSTEHGRYSARPPPGRRQPRRSPCFAPLSPGPPLLPTSQLVAGSPSPRRKPRKLLGLPEKALYATPGFACNPCLTIRCRVLPRGGRLRAFSGLEAPI